MKNKQKLSGTLEKKMPAEQMPGKPETERTKNDVDNKPRANAPSRDMKDRARKSFHNDGPGGNYHGY